jgi:hypothetical protein
MAIHEILTAARAEALFTSGVRTGAQLGRDETTEAIRAAVHRNGGVRGCAAEMAFAYGEQPEAARERMRWARRCVIEAYRR